MSHKHRFSWDLSASMSKADEESYQQLPFWIWDYLDRISSFVAPSDPRLPGFDGIGCPLEIDRRDIETEMPDVRMSLWSVARGDSFRKPFRPVGNVVHVLEAAGVVVSCYPMNGDRGFVVAMGGGGVSPVVILNANVTCGLTQQVHAACALGHLVLFRSLPWKFWGRRDSMRHMHNMARLFARLFILFEGMFSWSFDKKSLSVRHFQEIAQLWRCPTLEVIQRAQELKFITARQAGGFRAALSRPGGVRLVWEHTNKPVLLRHITEEIVEGGEFTRAEIARDLPYPRKDLERVLGVLPGYLIFEPERLGHLRLFPRDRRVVG